MNKKFKDISGQKFGMLLAIERDYSKNNKQIQWICRCDCGLTKSIRSNSLKSGHTKSCGCNMRIATTKHGETNTKLYRKYRSMINRCKYKNSDSFKNYGLRGISVCKDWMDSYEIFKEWAIKSGYVDGMTLDRINTNGNYEPKNCRWANWYTQANNKRNNKTIEYSGELKTLAEWARSSKVSYATFQKRIYDKNMSFQDAISKPALKSSTGIKNIYFHKQSKTYRVQFKINGKSKSFGSFKTIQDAKQRLENLRESL